MAHHASAKKRIRQGIKRRARNRLILSTVRTNIKSLRRAIDSGEQAEAEILLPKAVNGLNKAVTKGCLHWRTASRSISRLTKAVATIS